MLSFLTEDKLISINEELGYSVLNRSLVGSAISSWHYYSDIKDQICSVVLGIVKNHAFRDGNKRTAVLTYFILCDKLNLKPISDEKMFVNIVKIASSKDIDIREVRILLFN